ncbi:MAG: hypothetical protein ACM3JD_19145 [Rudaea sp.]
MSVSEPQPGGAATPSATPAAPSRTEVHAIPIKRPPYRVLRAFAFDPSLSQQLENALINRLTVKVPWEFDPQTGKDSLLPGPIGEYLEVIDVDPAAGCVYLPVNLDEPYLLAQNGLDPSEGNPQFHQQMVYAVAMTTIRNFERALGRTAFWAPDDPYSRTGGKDPSHDEYVRRLRIYPHALLEANAYYSPQKKALLFGHFPASVSDPRYHLPGGIVFSCLSHDIIAHETTHALLDGMHRRFQEASNPDVLAFHEAFADVVALFQHFTFPEALTDQIARTRGDLATENLLLQLAHEFGQAIESHGALRDALGEYVDGQWRPKAADPTALDSEFEPHARGAILVAAIFDAFVTIYKKRTSDLLRIATGGSGILPAGNLHPDLVKRLAAEAAKTAGHVLNMCIRALDYCPPVDLTFGDYMRALITSDSDMVPDDDLGYRLAFVDAFRKRGVIPRDVRTLSEDGLRWLEPVTLSFEPYLLPAVSEVKRNLPEWDVNGRSKEIYDRLAASRALLHRGLEKMGQDEDGRRVMQDLLGLDLSKPFEIHSLRPARREGPDGQIVTDLVIEITQSKPGYFSEALQAKVDSGWPGKPSAHLGTGGPLQGAKDKPPPGDFRFRGGCTLLVDLNTTQVRYCIYKRINSANRLARQRAFMQGETGASLNDLYFGDRDVEEPFALLHRSASGEDLQWEF